MNGFFLVKEHSQICFNLPACMDYFDMCCSALKVDRRSRDLISRMPPGFQLDPILIPY
ncbi:hypothetical protein C7475_108256 [Chitinophaga sp. S165]|nr:hypothetical protein C7475_108256 [Chitinophaga sp. S165]